MTISEFCGYNKITLDIWKADNNPNMPDATMNHYKARLWMGGNTLTIPFSTGSGWTRKPKVNDVFDCLISDYTTENFDEWARNFGYDTDSRKAKKICRACLSHSAKLKNFLGEKLLATALECERE